MISNKDFLSFDWPPRFITRPKQKKHYKHTAIITSTNNPDVGYVLEFSSESKARAHIKSAKQAKNALQCLYERQELPNINDEGIIEQ